MSSPEQMLASLRGIFNAKQLNLSSKLHRGLVVLAKYRSNLIARELTRRGGLTVRGGPFAGMTMASRVTEGCSAPKILGSYEQELHGFVRSLPERGYEAVIDIGCAEGYYAVGLARLLPEATIFAYDIDEASRVTCARLAERNGVADRLQVGGQFSPEDFQAFADRKTLVVCDIEGAEVPLIDPAAAPALLAMDILIELHDGIDESISGTIMGRFEATHDITFVQVGERNPGAYPELLKFSHLDQLLAVWEWRGGPTPWAWMTVKEG